jgi:hypothetical protein
MGAVFKPTADGGLGHVFRRLSEVDVGIDGQIEILDGPHPTGRIVGVQVKAGPSFFTSPSAEGWTVYIDQPTVHYWRLYAVPVILCVVDLESGVVYWARTDVGVFDATEKKYKIPLLRDQQLNAAAAPVIAQIAKTAPPSLFAQLALPPALVLREGEVRIAIGEGRLLHILDAAVATADDIWSAGFPYQAIGLARAILRALTTGVPVTTVLPLLERWTLRIVEELDDPESALRMLDIINAPQLASSPPLSTTLTREEQVRVRAMRARAQVAMGHTEEARSVAQQIAADAVMRDDAEFRLVGAMLAAMAALAGEQFSEAEEAFNRLASLPPIGSHNTTGQQRARNRATFARGLAGAPTDALVSLRAAAPGDEGFVAMAESWLLATVGDFKAASEAAMRIPMHGVASLDGYAVLRAYRMAGWADRKAVVIREPEAYDTVAYRLEALVRAQTPRRSMHERLRDVADDAVLRGKSREALLAAFHAKVAALHRADLAAYLEAYDRIAAAWRAAVLEEPSLEHIIHALAMTAATATDPPKTPEQKMFVRVVTEFLSGETAREALNAIRRAAINGDGAIGAFRLVAAFGWRWVFVGRDEALADLFRAALAVPTTPRLASVLVDAAQDALAALEPPLGPGAAAAVREAILSLGPKIHARSISHVLSALATTGCVATPPADGGLELAQYLISLEPAATQWHARREWLGAMALSARQFSGEARRMIRDVLVANAHSAGSPFGFNWDGVLMLLAAEINPAEWHAQGERAMAAAYFDFLESRLNAALAEVGSGSLGFREADWPELTEWAIPHVDPARRAHVGRLATTLLTGNGHILQMRMKWIPCIARLGHRTPEFAGEALEALRTAATGSLRGVGGFDEFMNPLSMFRNIGHTPDRVQALAVGWISLFLGTAEATVADGALRTLEEAATSTSHRVRLSVAQGLAWLLQATDRDQAMLPAERRHAVDRLLGGLARDHVAEVSVTALRAMAGIIGSEADVDR